MLETYISQIGKYELLSAEQERELAKEIQKGNRSAINTLVQSNLRLVVSIAKKVVKNYKISIMDVIQEGNIGLIAAAEKFSHSFNTKFSTYAYPWILQYMLRFVHNKTSFIAIPQRKEVLLRNLSKTQNSFIQKHGRYPTKNELCRLLDVNLKELDEIIAFEFSFSSLDAECSEEGDVTVGELIPDFTFNPETQLLKNEQIDEIHKLVKTLSDKEQAVITSRFNFEGRISAPTLREVSASLGVSAETVRQIEIRALKKIKKNALSLQRYAFFSA